MGFVVYIEGAFVNIKGAVVNIEGAVIIVVGAVNTVAGSVITNISGAVTNVEGPVANNNSGAVANVECAVVNNISGALFNVEFPYFLFIKPDLIIKFSVFNTKQQYIPNIYPKTHNLMQYFVASGPSLNNFIIRKKYSYSNNKKLNKKNYSTLNHHLFYHKHALIDQVLPLCFRVKT